MTFGHDISIFKLSSIIKYRPLFLTLGLFSVTMVCGFALSYKNPDLAIFAYGLAFGFLVLSAYQGFSNEHNKTAKKQLIEKQYEQLSDAVEILSEGFLLYDKDQNLVTVNKMIRDMTGELGLELKPGTPRKKVEQAILSWFDSNEHKTKIGNYLNSLKNNKSAFLDEIRFSTPKGRHLVLTEKFTRDQGIVSLVREETDAVNKQYEHGETSALLATVYDNIPLGICVLDVNSCIISWNEKYLSVMGVSPSMIYKGITLEQHLINIFDVYANIEESSQEFASATLARMTSASSSRNERHLKNGKIIEIARSSLPGGGYICTFNDVTLEKSTQLLLKESENRYRKMVELSPEAILVHKDGIIIYANGAAIRLLEAKNLYSIVGDNVRKFFPVADHDLLHNHFGPADHLAPGEIVSAERSQVIGKIGKRIDVELEASALLYGDRPVMQIVARDISAQTKAQILLEKAKEEAEYAAQLKGTFLANMSHELRTPLNAVIGFSEIIKNEIYGKVGSEKYVEYAGDIHASGIHLLDLINDILDLSKVESGAQEISEEEINIGTLVEECVRLTDHQRGKNNIELNSYLNSILPSVYCDPKMIKQVIINLLSNAIKFTPQGGKVSIHCVIEGNGSLALSVQDTGIGIRQDDIQKALTPFVQVDSELSRKYQGTGLGLSLSKNLMELHGGNLIVESEYGTGTNVTINLPPERVIRSAA